MLNLSTLNVCARASCGAARLTARKTAGIGSEYLVMISPEWMQMGRRLISLEPRSPSARRQIYVLRRRKILSAIAGTGGQVGPSFESHGELLHLDRLSAWPSWWP